MFQDVTRDRAKTLTRAGQVGAVALASLAGVVLAVGLPGTGAPQIERPEPIVPAHAAEPAPTVELPAVLEKRASAIASNLAQLGNSPKIPEKVPEPSDETLGGDTEMPAPQPQVDETAVAFLGLLGSPARPMALVSIDGHQQVLAAGDIIHKGSGEKIKLVKVEKGAIEIEIKGSTKKIELASRTGATYTTLQSSGGTSVPGFVPPPQPVMPPPPGPNRVRRDSETRFPGGRRGNQRFDEAGGVRE